MRPKGNGFERLRNAFAGVGLVIQFGTVGHNPQLTSTLLMKTTQVDNIQEAFKVAEGFPAPIGEKTFYAFRGHSNVDYNLAPSLWRVVRDGFESEEEVVDLEKRLTFEFRRRSRHHRPKATEGFYTGSDSDCSTQDLWQTMQHHGSPTRLLDWTRSFYIALYFAVVSSPDSDGAIVVIDTSAIENWANLKYDQKPPGLKASADVVSRPLLFTPTPNFERAIIQQGLFTMPTTILCDHDELFIEAHKRAGKEMEKVRIRKECKPLLLSQLVAMNLTAATLFPGIDGIARSVQELALLAAADA